jgi:hypothetical protein
MNGHFVLLLFFLSSSSPVGFVRCIAVVCMGGERGEGVDCICLYISYSAILPYHLFGGYIFFILRVLMPLSSRPFL